MDLIYMNGFEKMTNIFSSTAFFSLFLFQPKEFRVEMRQGWPSGATFWHY